MKLGDIGVLAESIEKSIPEIAQKNNGEDIRRRLKIHVSVSEDELKEINKELYEMTNHTKLETSDSSVDSIVLDVVGIEFVISTSENLL